MAAVWRHNLVTTAAALLLFAVAAGSARAQANWTQTITWQGALWQVMNGEGGPARHYRWTIGPAAPTRHLIDWQGTLARFQTQNSAGTVIQQQSLPAANPTAAQRLSLNLWLNQTHPPSGDGSLEAIISAAGTE